MSNTTAIYEIVASEIKMELKKYQDYEDIAGYKEKYKAVWELAHRLGNEFKLSDENFDRIKFYQDCGIGSRAS